MIVKENISFKRTGNPKISMGIGKSHEIHKWFEKWAPSIEYKIANYYLIIIYGDFYLKSRATNLPGNLYIKGNADFGRSMINLLPERMTVEGNLFLDETNIEHLPDNLKVEGSLYARKSFIRTIGENIYVGKNLDLRDTLLEKISEGLTVGMDLDLRNSSLKKIGNNVMVMGDLSIKDTPLGNKKNIWPIINRVKKNLPEDLYIGGDIIWTNMK